MTLEQAKNYLSNKGLSSCSCRYGGSQGLIEEAIRQRNIEEEENKKPISN
jgi:hypothetical protein